MTPEIFYGIGALILVAVLFYVATRRRSRAAEQIGDNAVRQNYREENARSKAEGNG